MTLNWIFCCIGSMEEAKKNMYAFSTTTYTGFQCTVDEETSEKFKGLPGVLWVLPDSYIDVKNKDYGGDKYINGEIIPCTYPTYQPKERRTSKYESRRYERRRDGPPANRRPRQQAPQTESASSWVLQAFIHILLKQQSTRVGTMYGQAGKSILSPKYHAELCKWPAQLGFGSCGWVLIFWADYDISVWHMTENPDSSKVLLFSQLLGNYPHDIGCRLA